MKRNLVLGLTFGVLIALPACKTDDNNKKDMSLRPAPDAAPTEQIASPGHYRDLLTRQAMRGLTYDTGRVVVDEDYARQLPDYGDIDAAWAAYEEGWVQLLEKNMRIDALGAFTRAILIKSDLSEFYVGLGQTLTWKFKFAEAEAALRTGLDLDPDSVDLWSRLADVLQRTGRLEEAIAAYRQVLDHDANHPEAHGRLASLLYYTNDLGGARHHVDAAQAAGYPVPKTLPKLISGEVPTAPRAAKSRNAPTVGPQIRIDLNGGTEAANETTAASTDMFPMEVVTAWNDWRESGFSEVIRMGVGVSLDGGETWDDFVVRPPTPNQSSVEGDPMTCYDNRTGHLWVGAISFAGNGGVYVARKVQGSTNFEPSVMAYASGGADKCWMAAGADPDDPDQTRVYVAFNAGCVRSTDLGDSWSSPVSLGSGIGYLPRVGPNGELYIAYWDFGSGVLMKRSLNGGLSFTTHTIATRMDVWGTQEGSRFPGDFRVPSMNYIAVDPNDGTLYCIYFDTTSVFGGQYNVDLYFTKSTDQGTSWTDPVVINGDMFPPGDQFWPWLEVDSEGRIHVCFFDTRRQPVGDDNEHGLFDVYYSYSTDGGDSWTEHRLTPTMFDSFDDGLDRFNQFLGDYNGLAVGQNRVYPCYLSSQNGDPDIYTNLIIWPVGTPGDMDCDGDVDFDDINAFVLALSGQAAYETQYPDCRWLNGDIDENGTVDFDDINPFVTLIGG